MPTIAIGALVGSSLYESRKGRKANEKARKVDEKRSRLQTGKQAVEQVRQAQIARASVIARGESQGAGESSAVRGAAGSIQSQAGGNISFAQQVFGLQQSASRLRGAAEGHFARSQAYGKLASFVSVADSSSSTSSPAPVTTATPGV